VIDDGVTGFVVNSMENAAAAIRRVSSLSRLQVRSRFLERFTAKRMAADYCDVYERLLSIGAPAGQFVAPTPYFGTDPHPSNYVSPLSAIPK
jgi:hypothetical protein